jgi:hypothetical protein
MVKSRIFALIFRSLAAILTVLSLLASLGVFEGKMYWGLFRYYTVQSNILVLALFIYLAIKTAKAIKESGSKGSACFSPRLCASVLMCIMLTLVVFWLILSPRFIATPMELLKFRNSGVHLLVPLLVLADYIMFNVSGHLKKYDPFLFMIIPLVYLVFVTIIGLAGAIYKIKIDDIIIVRHFPYFFVDYYVMGWLCAIYIPVFIIIYLGFGFLMYSADAKKAKRIKQKQQQPTPKNS